MDDKKYTLEWSKKQNAFHIQPLEASLAGNQSCFLSSTSHDFITLMVGTSQACTAMADNHRDKLMVRSMKAANE